MARPLELPATLDADGRLPSRERARLRGFLRSRAGQEVVIKVSGPKRSTSANAYYWGVVIPAFQLALTDDGNPLTPEAIHYHFKCEYLRPQVFELDGVTHTIPGSTATLDREEFTDYLWSIRTGDLAMRLGVEFPDPDGVWRSYKVEDRV